MWRLFRQLVLILLASSLSAAHAICACAEASALAAHPTASRLAAAIPEAHAQHELTSSAHGHSDVLKTGAEGRACDHAPGACNDRQAASVTAAVATGLMAVGGEQSLAYGVPPSAAVVHPVPPSTPGRAAQWPRPPPPLTPVTLKVRLLN